MLICDVLHKEKVYQKVVNDLRDLGVKHRWKKSTVKIEKLDRNRETNLRKIFKVSLSYQPLEVVSLSSGAIVHVPVFVSQATSFLDKCLHQEGLFRKAGSHARQKELVARLDNGGTLGDKNHAIDVANCLKTFFRDLPEPLVPFAYHDLLVRCLVLRERRVEALLLGCILLPPHHLNTLAFFMGFLKRVSTYESQNKMSVDNLAKVVGPNVMPLQETTMSAVQSRLEAHLVIVKILIENAEKIGVVPERISEAIAAEAMGSVETELNRSEESSRARCKKKKHRSGSLTRMFNGLRKMVGKGEPSPGDVNQMNNQLLPAEMDPLHTPSIKIGKKRKVTESSVPISVKKKRDILDTMPERTTHPHTRILFASPVSSNPNPVRERSPVHKSKVRKYLTHKVHSEIRVFDKVDKSKKLRMSLDRLVSRSKQKIADIETVNDKPCEEFTSPRIERRWSSASSSSATKKSRDEKIHDKTLQSSPMIRKATTLVNVRDDYDRIFMEADVNLSDDWVDSHAQPNTLEKNQTSTKHSRETNSCRRSLHAALSPISPTSFDSPTDYNSLHNKNISSSSSTSSGRRFSTNENTFTNANANSTITSTTKKNNDSEEYVRIPKSEYEEIKNRVSAIESRISQEFNCINTETSSILKKSALNVQTEYEKILDEASMDNTTTTDNLAKRLSRELKIRRSNEHKIIRSPSARKIGILRRRSQEKLPNKRAINRTASWHVTQPTEQPQRSKKFINNDCTTPKRQRNSRNLNFHHDSNQRADSLCSDETNARLNYLQQQLHTLITHTAEHTRGSVSDDENFENYEDDEIFQNSQNEKFSSRPKRASSFHGNEFIDNSQYFNNRVKELKKTNSQQNVGHENCLINDNNSGILVDDCNRQKPISWKDASGYFKMENRSNVNTPVQPTGRASIAKLRTQNAGMVLAKAKLFDERKSSNDDEIFHKKTFRERENNADLSKITEKRVRDSRTNDHGDATRKMQNSRRKNAKSPKNNNNARLRLASSPNYSPVIKMELTILPTQSSSRQQSDKRGNRRLTQKFDMENREFVRQDEKFIRDDDFGGKMGLNDFAMGDGIKSPPVAGFAVNTILQEANVNIHDPDVNNGAKTPHIKRPLAVKTPKSARSLAKRPAVDTRRTPLKAIPTSVATPTRQSPRIVSKSRNIGKPIN